MTNYSHIAANLAEVKARIAKQLKDEIYARLREPYGYWNAIGLTAALVERTTED